MKVLILAGNKSKEVLEEFERIGVDPGGIKEMLPKAQHFNIKVKGLSVPSAIILKQQMLSIGGDVAVSRGVIDYSLKTTDVIVMGTIKQIKALHKSLKKQPFSLKKLGDDLLQAIHRWKNNDYKMKFDRYELDISKGTHIMGILNTTPDSFSDGGRYDEIDSAVCRACQMVDEGAHIIDVGGESSRPGATPVTIEEEIQRVIPIIERISREVNVPISIDTYKAETARRALDAGATMINDISGLRFDKEMINVAANGRVPVVIMHMQGTPGDMQKNPSYDSVVDEVIEFLSDRIDEAVSGGIKEDMIIIDPGQGFGKLPRHNLKLLRYLDEFKTLGCPILIGTSRKSLIGQVLDLPVSERLEGTIATCVASVMNGANICRVHDVKEVARAVKMTDTIMRKGEDSDEL